MNDAQYRKTLSALRTKISIIENNLREKDYTFDYSKLNPPRPCSSIVRPSCEMMETAMMNS